ncbi:hypothetical protein FOL47_010003 [Perkinsus chesapeaki]|uniref:Amino acid transporter transmembrane domain-containing protein n=1 Tax=Perkinsus chesapeaki TaxID=330153 RepID=A0A7J6MQK1_PERCH|nr:hypothetical protein FOL47_010003 [Perkinsus chesapeaki]
MAGLLGGSSQQPLLSLLSGDDLTSDQKRGSESIFGPGSFLSTTLLLVGAALGAGALSLPYAMISSGPLVGSICFIACACIAVISNLILFTAVTKTGLHTYGAVVDWALDRLGLKKESLEEILQEDEMDAYHLMFPLSTPPRFAFFELWAFIYCMMTCVSYLVFLGDFIPSIAGQYIQCVDSEAFRKICIVACAYLAIYPMSATKSISVLRYVSSLSIWAIILTAVAVLIRAPALVEAHAEEAHRAVSVDGTHFNMGTFSTFAVCMFGLMNQIPSVKVASEMTRPTTMRRTMVNVLAGVVLTLIYLGIAIAVYLSFLNNTRPNFMQNYPHNDILMLVCRIGLTIMLLVAGPMNMLPGLAGLYKAIELGAGTGMADGTSVKNPYFSLCRWIESHIGVQSTLTQYGGPLLSITFCTIVALMVPNIASFIGAVSSYLAAPLVCGLPGLVYAALLVGDDNKGKIWPLPIFLEELEKMGIGVPEEAISLLSHNEKARGVHFADLAKILIRANKPCETPPSPAPSQVSEVSEFGNKRTTQKDILRLGDECASAKAPFDNDYVADNMSPSGRSICSDALSWGSRYSHNRSYDVLQRGRGVAAALGVDGDDDDDIGQLADLEATLRSNASSGGEGGQTAPALRSHLASGSVQLVCDESELLFKEPRRHPETEYSRAASDHGMGILYGCVDDNESVKLSPKKGVTDTGHKSRKHYTGQRSSLNLFSWEDKSSTTTTENSNGVNNTRRSFYPYATEQDDLNVLRGSINRAPLARVGRTSASGSSIHPDADLASLLH